MNIKKNIENSIIKLDNWIEQNGWADYEYYLYKTFLKTRQYLKLPRLVNIELTFIQAPQV